MGGRWVLECGESGGCLVVATRCAIVLYVQRGAHPSAHADRGSGVEVR